MNLTLFIIPAAFLAGVLFWSAISFLIAIIGGWRALAHKFRAQNKPSGTSFYLERAYFNSTQYSGCLTIIASDIGLYIAVLPIFPGHAPLLIPYDQLAPFKERKMMWLSLFETRVRLEKYKSITIAFSNQRLVAAIQEKQDKTALPSVFSSFNTPPIPPPFLSGPR